MMSRAGIAAPSMTACLKESPRTFVRWLLLTLLIKFSPRTAIEGVEVVDAAEDSTETTTACLRDALTTLRDNDVRRYARLTKDLRRILVVKGGGPEFAPEVGACVLSARYVREAGADSLATTMVHQATHARIWRTGVRWGAALATRVEHICIKEQMAFAARLGNDTILASLRRKAADPSWRAAKEHERRNVAWSDLRRARQQDP